MSGLIILQILGSPAGLRWSGCRFLEDRILSAYRSSPGSYNPPPWSVVVGIEGLSDPALLQSPSIAAVSGLSQQRFVRSMRHCGERTYHLRSKPRAEENHARKLTTNLRPTTLLHIADLRLTTSLLFIYNKPSEAQPPIATYLLPPT